MTDMTDNFTLFRCFWAGIVGDMTDMTDNLVLGDFDQPDGVGMNFKGR